MLYFVKLPLPSISGVGSLWLGGQIQAIACICTACRLLIVFIFFNSWRIIKRRRVSYGMWTSHEKIQLSVCINKVLLEHSHVYLFTYCQWLFSCYDIVDRDHLAHKAKHVFCLALYRQRLSTPDLSDYFRLQIQNKDIKITCKVLVKRKAHDIMASKPEVKCHKGKSAHRDEFYKAHLLKKF